MNLEITVTIIILSTLLAFLIAFPIISFLYRYKIVRIVDVDFSILIESRKNKVGTPIMGGLIVIITVLIINLTLNFNAITATLLLIFIGLAIVGGADDILNLFGTKRRTRSIDRTIKLMRVHKSTVQKFKLFITLPWAFFNRVMSLFESNPGKGLFAHERLLLQFIASIGFTYWYFNSGVIEDPTFFSLPFIGGISIGILMVPFIIITFLGMINAVNFSDGLDGLSAGMLLNAFIGFLIIAFLEVNLPILLLCGTVVGALITYLYFNIPPARIQMGDIGTYSLGGLLAMIGIVLGEPLLIFIICFPFVVEVSSTVLQSSIRKLFGRRFLKMAPIHHHFEMLGWSEEKVVMRFWLFSSFCTLIGVWVYFW